MTQTRLTRWLSVETDSGGAPYGGAALLVAATTALAALVRDLVSEPDLVMLYLIGILIVAVRSGRGPAILAAALSVACYDFFLVPPYYTFNVAELRHVLTFGMMFVVGLVTGALTERIRRQEQEARRREEATKALYALSRDLGGVVDETEVARIVSRHAQELLGGGAAILRPGIDGSLRDIARSGAVPFEAAEEQAAQWALDHSAVAGLGTDVHPGSKATCVPLCPGPEARGVLVIAGASPGPGHDRRFLEAFGRQAALALERARLAEDARAAALKAQREELRSSLLSTVSHDLRTPLAVITGAATALRDEASEIAAGPRADLVDTICEEAERLERLVGNLLDMTRLESGGMEVKREWVPIEEVLGAALERLDPRLEGRAITMDIADDVPLASADPVLLEQVFLNLLDNAARYTPAQSPIEIRARRAERDIVIVIADRGQGLPPGSEALVFEKFYRGPHAGAPGAGLGLAICRGIVEAHGGKIVAENRKGGGASFRMTLPVPDCTPALVAPALPSLEGP